MTDDPPNTMHGYWVSATGKWAQLIPSLDKPNTDIVTAIGEGVLKMLSSPDIAMMNIELESDSGAMTIEISRNNPADLDLHIKPIYTEKTDD